MSEMISVAAYKFTLPFEGMIAAINTYRNRVKTSKALNALSSRELEDIGLCRADIETVVRNIR